MASGKRSELQTLLENLAGNDHVYFQEPPNLGMQYPCILYKRDSEEVVHADNRPYSRTKGYQVTVIDRSPDSQLAEKIADLPMCEFDRHYRAENLNHFVYTLFF